MVFLQVLKKLLKTIFTIFTIENGILMENGIAIKNCNSHTNEGQLASTKEEPLISSWYFCKV